MDLEQLFKVKRTLLNKAFGPQKRSNPKEETKGDFFEKGKSTYFSKMK
jgi:hypothetical protein